MACVLLRSTAGAGGSTAGAMSIAQPLRQHFRQQHASLACITRRGISSGRCSSSDSGSSSTDSRRQQGSVSQCVHGSRSRSQGSPSVRRQLCSVAAASAAQQVAPEATADPPHVSVLLAEVLAAFEGRQVRRYVDGTLGAAGHAGAMLAQHPELQTLVGFDLDPTAHALASARLSAAGAGIVPVAVSATGTASFDAAAAAAAGPGPTAFLVRSNFGRMARVLQQLPLDGAGGDAADGSGCGVDAILLDLGISSMQVGRHLSRSQWQDLVA